MTALDEIARELREWRLDAGSPSFSELARRVGALRAGASGDARRLAPGRVTVYDCFREGRSRIDVELAVDLGRALGVEGAELAAWRTRCTEAMRPAAESGLVTASTVLGEPVQPSVRTSVDAVDGDRVLLAGMGGSGKTQAALRLLARWRAEGRVEGVLTLRLDGPGAAPGALVHAAAHELRARLPEDPDLAAARVVDLLVRQGYALFVDDLGDPAQVAPFLGADPGLPLVATSRQALVVPGMERVDVAPWTAEEVTAYLGAVVGTDRIAAEPAATRALVDLTGGLPLVTALVAARAHGTRGWTLHDHATALGERRSGDRVEDAVRVCLDATVDALSSGARALLRVLASGPREGLRVETLRSVCDVAVESALTELTTAYLLGPHDERHRLHDVPRAYARARALDEEPPSVRVRREDRLLDRLCAEAWGVAEVISPSDVESRRFDREAAPVPDPRSWLSVDLQGALDLAQVAADRRPVAALELAEAMGTALERAGLSSLSIRLHTQARDAATRLEDPVGEARARCALAITRAQQGKQVRLEEPLALATRVDDRLSMIRLGNLRGIVAMRSGREAEGLAAFRSTYDLAQESGLDSLLPAMANNLAVALTGAGELEEALTWARRAASGHPGMMGQGLSALSATQLLLGRHAEAIESAQGAIAEAERLGEGYALVDACCQLGEALTAAGQLDRALEEFTRAEAVQLEYGLDTMEARVSICVGKALLARGDRAGAARRFHAALGCQLDNPIDPATALHQLGRLAAASDPDRARDLYDQALSALGDGSAYWAHQIRADRDALDRAAPSSLTG